MAEDDIRRKSNMEKAEGDRETAEENLGWERSGAIPDRTLNDEKKSEQRVPERGDKKDDEPLTRVDI